MNTISFVTANYVAQQTGYSMTGGWGQGERTTQEYFRPIETFPERFDALLANIQALGFTSIDLWLAHLSPRWATPEHIAAAKAALAGRGMQVTSLAGGFGDTPEEFEATCRIAVELGAPVLGGSTPLLASSRDLVVDALHRYGLRLGIENHPEKTAAELREKIGDGGDGTIGATIDTGWFGTHGYDAAQAIRDLWDVIFAVHLKDVRAPGGHDTVCYGAGCVPIHACITALMQIGYRGTISVEHEPEHSDPTEDVRASYAMLREWLAE